MLANPIDKFQSLPNIRGSINSDVELRRLYSLSLSQLRKHSDFPDYNHKPSPFNLRWIHGYNAKSGVINLNTLGSTTVFYAASYCAVLFNWTTNQMRILQGHRHMVTCLAADALGRWLVTADSGPENIVIVWDATDYFPQRTLFSPHGDTKLAKVAISADAKYLLTLGYPEKAALHWWIWSSGYDTPHATLNVDLPRDSVLDMEFNPSDSEQFLLMTNHVIWIGVIKKVELMERGLVKETDDFELKIRKVEISSHADSGRFTCFTFVENPSQVLVATTRGAVLIYGYSLEYHENASAGNYENLKFVKVLKIEKHKINVIKSVDGVIATGNHAGEIHFYDEQMRLVYWVHGFQVDSVRGLSFNVSPRSYQVFDPQCGKACPCWEKVVTEVDPLTGLLKQKLLKLKLPDDATKAGTPFIVRDFIVCTSNEGVGFVDFVTEKFKTILNNKIAPSSALTVHPEKPFVCIGFADGFIEMFNFVKHQIFTRLDLRGRYKIVTPPKDDSIKGSYEIMIPDLAVTCLKYSPSGLHLACGLNTGMLMFLDPTTIDILTDTFQDTSYGITEINYSPDSLTLAFAYTYHACEGCSVELHRKYTLKFTVTFVDQGRTVGVYKYDCTTCVWTFIGKHRSHYKDISTVFFLNEKNEGGDYKLLSLGKDRSMVEYDIANSSDEYLEVFSLDRVEQAAVPLKAIPWPNPKGLDPAVFRDNLPMILMATDEFKYKIVNYATTMTLSTVLGPRYDQPVCWMQLVSKKEDNEDGQYLVFATKNTIGLQKMPLDGNPWKHVGLLAHPTQVTQMCFREDLGVLFTIGAKDSTMSQWAANYRAVDFTTKNGGADLDPYYCLIENGRPGWLFQEIRDLFYYIQILCQGTFSPAMRRVKDYIPIDSLPDLMRALGYFPSEYDVENLIVEARHKVYLREPATEIDFEEFVKLYLNHRPAFGDNYKRIRNAFKNFAQYRREIYQMRRQEFVEMLEEYGECFTQELTCYLLSIVSGQSFEDRAAMTEVDFSFMPEQVTFDYLLTFILGIQDMDNVSEQNSAMDSLCSRDTLSHMSDFYKGY